MVVLKIAASFELVSRFIKFVSCRGNSTGRVAMHRQQPIDGVGTRQPVTAVPNLREEVEAVMTARQPNPVSDVRLLVQPRLPREGFRSRREPHFLPVAD